jgi:hypothetical protein
MQYRCDKIYTQQEVPCRYRLGDECVLNSDCEYQTMEYIPFPGHLVFHPDDFSGNK